MVSYVVSCRSAWGLADAVVVTGNTVVGSNIVTGYTLCSFSTLPGIVSNSLNSFEIKTFTTNRNIGTGFDLAGKIQFEKRF